jgi:hypothetical protein
MTESNGALENAQSNPQSNAINSITGIANSTAGTPVQPTPPVTTKSEFDIDDSTESATRVPFKTSKEQYWEECLLVDVKFTREQVTKNGNRVAIICDYRSIDGIRTHREIIYAPDATGQYFNDDGTKEGLFSKLKKDLKHIHVCFAPTHKGSITKGITFLESTPENIQENVHRMMEGVANSLNTDGADGKPLYFNKRVYLKMVYNKQNYISVGNRNFIEVVNTTGKPLSFSLNAKYDKVEASAYVPTGAVTTQAQPTGNVTSMPEWMKKEGDAPF